MASSTSFVDMTGQQIWEVLLEKKIAIIDELDPDIVYVNPEWVKVIGSLTDGVIEVIEKRAEDKVDAVTGIATVSYVKWKGYTDIDEVQIASLFLVGVYCVHEENEMAEFLARLRLGERVNKGVI